MSAQASLDAVLQRAADRRGREPGRVPISTPLPVRDVACLLVGFSSPSSTSASLTATRRMGPRPSQLSRPCSVPKTAPTVRAAHSTFHPVVKRRPPVFRAARWALGVAEGAALAQSVLPTEEEEKDEERRTQQ